MPRSSFVDFKAVKAAVHMEQVLQHYGLLDRFKRGEDSLSGPCPIHKGSNPTQFRVSLSKNVWNCFSECKHGGNVLDFIAKMENVSIHTAAVKAIEWFKLDPDAMAAEAGQELAEPAAAPKPGTASKQVAAPAAPVAKPAPENNAPNVPLKFRLDKLDREHPYLKERGLTLETIIDFGIGHCAKGMMADASPSPFTIPRATWSPTPAVGRVNRRKTRRNTNSRRVSKRPWNCSTLIAPPKNRRTNRGSSWKASLVA